MLLWSAATLSDHLGDPDLRLIDLRWVLGQPGAGRAAYDAGHIPGALHLDIDTDLAQPDGFGAPGRHPLPDARAFAARLGRLGIGTGDSVVAYDDAGGGHAARLWWMLDDLGHRHVHVLDGGIGTWIATGLPLDSDVPSWRPARLDLADGWSRVVGREALASMLGTAILLDVRAPERYRGETEPVDPVAGHIPTAVNAPGGGNLGPDGRFLAPEALAARFASLGVHGSEAGASVSGESVPRVSEAQVVTSCGSGVTACQTALAMRVAGLPDPILYPGSYSDWTRAGMPVAVGSEPGRPTR